MMKGGRLPLGRALIANSSTVEVVWSRTREPEMESVADVEALSNWRSESMKRQMRTEVTLGSMITISRTGAKRGAEATYES